MHLKPKLQLEHDLIALKAQLSSIESQLAEENFQRILLSSSTLSCNTLIFIFIT
jgi:hypothetical protein